MERKRNNNHPCTLNCAYNVKMIDSIPPLKHSLYCILDFTSGDCL